ncbi:phosphonoacetaldehyde hydrolase [Endozoicomonas gorgoniicola]|uniref:Phosphonoacetaldehyde hydrolase n=1 Tax=Endozoicomonas gorgoniicola TaxID=1234144 RepID=A0ABT3N3G7_9GAMM|nr:phosphonoacetaldehyde hydrolase [Endozoicomonas gorgoniicola]MCW7555749.1 phosphonoacetaldehyde hydrolase [Endozoicomonas gorgoniicola]
MSHNIEAVILDWAGTVVDFGSWAPTSIFVEAFKQAYDFDVSLEEARVPMGLGKWDHIKTLGQLPEVAERWLNQFGHPMADKDVDDIYSAFMPLQKAKVTAFSDPIPGALETVAQLRANNVKIGSCSGYPREVMDILVPAAEAKGYKPDAVVATDDLAAGGRPGPWMALHNVIELGINNVSRCVKVDDSAPGIMEGLNAGMWTVGLTLSGNEAGMTLDEYLEASEAVKEEKRRVAEDKLLSAGAHYVIDTIADLPAVIAQIEQRIANGEKP